MALSARRCRKRTVEEWLRPGRGLRWASSGPVAGGLEAEERPPVAERRECERSKHGRKWQDPYHWLRLDRGAALDYLRRENAYAERVMDRAGALRRELEAEMAGRMTRRASCPPERSGSWLYYTQVPEGKEYPVYFRKKEVLGKRNESLSWSAWAASVLNRKDEATEEVLLDQNLLVEQLSEDHSQLAFTVDTSGNEQFTLFIKDLETGQTRKLRTTDGVMSAEWARTGRMIFYTVVNDLMRPSRLFCHSFDSDEEDKMIFAEPDESCFLDVSRTKDWSFITVNVNSKTSSEVHLINADDPLLTLLPVQKRKSGLQYFVEHNGGLLYVLTNGDLSNDESLSLSKEYRLVCCPIKQLDSRDWQEIVGLEDGSFIEDMEMFAKYIVLYKRKSGRPFVQVLEFPLVPSSNKQYVRSLRLPQEICTVIPGANEDFYSSVLRVSVSSPNLPETVVDYNLASGSVAVLHQDEIVGLTVQRRGGTRAKELLNQSRRLPTAISCKSHLVSLSDAEDPHLFIDLSSRYICRHEQVIGIDGVPVPLTMVHASGLLKDGQNPALLIGYGAYGKPLEMEWCSERLSLLDRGWVIAFSHVRGGGELGKAWHQSGCLLQKKTSFRDFIAAAEFLVNQRYAHQHKLSAWGASAGGLLVAAAVNLHPSLFRAVILQVPFVDISNSLLDKGQPLSVHEYDEWGNPDDPEDFDYIRSYSPYDNVQVGAQYPAMLVKTGYLDTRVGYWEAAKWVAKARDCTKQSYSGAILLKTSMDTGHFGEGGRFAHLRETASDYAFLIKMVD